MCCSLLRKKQPNKQKTSQSLPHHHHHHHHHHHQQQQQHNQHHHQQQHHRPHSAYGGGDGYGARDSSSSQSLSSSSSSEMSSSLASSSSSLSSSTPSRSMSLPMSMSMSMASSVRGLLPEGAAMYRYDEIVAATGGFDPGKKMGNSVWKASLRNATVAIARKPKHLHHGSSGLRRRELSAAVRSLHSLHHSCLVKLLGACAVEGEEFVYLVYELLESSSLDDALRSKIVGGAGYSALPSWPSRLRIAVDVAKGLEYLHHHCHPCIVHKYLDSRHVLVFSSASPSSSSDSKMLLRAKIAYVGLSALTGDVHFPDSKSAKPLSPSPSPESARINASSSSSSSSLRESTAHKSTSPARIDAPSLRESTAHKSTIPARIDASSLRESTAHESLSSAWIDPSSLRETTAHESPSSARSDPSSLRETTAHESPSSAGSIAHAISKSPDSSGPMIAHENPDPPAAEEKIAPPKRKLSRNRSIKINGFRGYMPPEYTACGAAAVSPKYDVYSFGIILAELMSGKDRGGGNAHKQRRLPIPEMLASILASPEAKGELRMWMDPLLRDSFPIEDVLKVAAIARSCLDPEPEKRPDMSEVASNLQKYLASAEKWQASVDAQRELLTTTMKPR